MPVPIVTCYYLVRNKIAYKISLKSHTFLLTAKCRNGFLQSKYLIALFDCNQMSKVYNVTVLVHKAVGKVHLNQTSHIVIGDNNLHAEKNERLIPLLCVVLW